MILLVFAKVTATAITLESGCGGGVFSPSLYVNAMTGGAFGFVAAMITIAVSSIVTHQFLGRSFFTWQLLRQGISLKGGRAWQIFLSVRARHIMGDDFRTVTESGSISDLRHLLRTAPHDHFFVTNTK